MGKRPLWITLLLWFLLIGDALLLALCDSIHWFPVAIILLAQLFLLIQEIRGRSLLSENSKSNVIGLLVTLLIETALIIIALPNAID
jgi:hypothetical protein